MTVIAFEPHADDLALFAAYTALRYRAHVVTVLRGDIQAARGAPVTPEIREGETDCAMSHLELTHEQWPFSDADPDWQAVLAAMAEIRMRLTPELVLAPAVEPDGHDQHNHVGELALAVFGPEKVVRYMTYRRGQGRSLGVEVDVESEWIVRKLRAVGCYESQMFEWSTRPWFLDYFTTREWVAA